MAKVGILGGINNDFNRMQPYDIATLRNNEIMFYKDMAQSQIENGHYLGHTVAAIKLYTVPNDVKMAVVDISGFMLGTNILATCANIDGKTAAEVYKSLMHLKSPDYPNSSTSGAIVSVKCMVLGPGDSVYVMTRTTFGTTGYEANGTAFGRYQGLGISCTVTGIEHV